MIVNSRAGARIGLVGNPSDGYYGKTISVAIQDFHAEVRIKEARTLRIIPHPTYDPAEFESLQALEAIARQDGYYGGRRVLFATCKKFAEYCRLHEIRLDRRAFTIEYETCIPRQVGLAGSSAIITAAVRGLMMFYGLSADDIPDPVLPNLVLSIETEELGIAAGLQDRVIQVYGGMVYMDFDRDLLESRGYGEYVRLNLDLLPRIYLAYTDHPSDSGKIHSNVRVRFQNGDPDVIQAMRTFASYAMEAREALERHDTARLGQLMDSNFDLRRRIFGDSVLGPQSLEMIQIARSLGFPSTFPGSGGAVIGLFETDSDCAALKTGFTYHGYQFHEVHPDPHPACAIAYESGATGAGTTSDQPEGRY